jgi:hypothetical protein
LFRQTLSSTPATRARPPTNRNRVFPIRTTPFGTPRIPHQTRPKRGDAFSVGVGQKNTSHATVMPRATPAGLPVICTGLSLPAFDRASQANAIAMLGTASQVATTAPPVVAANTYAPSAVPLPIPLKSARPPRDLLIINTPFVPDEWEKLLNNITPFNPFPDVHISMRFGFDMGVYLPPPHTFTPPNHNSALLYPDHVLSHIHTELALGRYSGPFSRTKLESLIGPFRTSPLGTVPKSIDSPDRRIVQDLSFPRDDPSHPSVNDQINIEHFRCDWGTFNQVREIVIDAPDLSEAATLDVDAAFRCCPITPSQQSSFIIHWDDSYYIDHNAPFGATSAGGVFGRVADAKSAILASKNLGPSKNWVDDFVFFRFPISFTSGSPSFSYSLSDLYDLGSQLGWPWKESKTRPFSHEFKYLGFIWNLPSKTVSIPDAKKLRYLNKLQPWTQGQKFPRKAAESVLGTLVHCSLALPDGRSRLPSISRFAASFNHLDSPHAHRSPNPSVLSDIEWWRLQFSAPFCGSTLSKPPPASSASFWVDASTSWGIGIVFNDEWDFWQLCRDWDRNGRNIGWAEMVAIELGLLFAIHKGHSHTHFIIRSDNQGVIHAIRGGKSRSPEQNLVLQRITSLLSQHNLWISSLYVPSLDNLADRPSRGLPASNGYRINSTFDVPFSLRHFLVRPSA